MRGIASYAMLGRRQSIIVVLLFGFFPVAYCVSAAIVGLVNLRKGFGEGLLVLLWSLLPAGYFWYMGDTSPVLLMVGITILAQVLRRTGSWGQVLATCLLLGMLTQLSLHWQGSYVAQLQMLMEQALESRQMAGDLEGSPDELLGLLLRYYGIYHMGLTFLCLVLSRWWQAALYNPGGLREEFHGLRLDPRFSAGLGLLILVGMAGVSPVDQWLPMLGFPLLVNGVALCHGLVGLKQLGNHWLVLCYLGVVLMAPAMMLLGLMDGLLNLRKRIRV